MNEMIALAAGLLLAGFVLYAAYKRAYERQIGRALHGRPVRVHLPEMRTVMRAYLMLCVILGSAFVIVKADEHYDAARYACAGEEGDQGVFTAETGTPMLNQRQTGILMTPEEIPLLRGVLLS